jgi:hypothetical protein
LTAPGCADHPDRPVAATEIQALVVFRDAVFSIDLRSTGAASGPSIRGVAGGPRRVGAVPQAPEQTDRRWQVLDTEEMVARRNRLLRRRATYFCLGTVHAAYRKVTAHACNRLRQWLARKHTVRGSGWSRFSNRYLYETLGLIRLQRPPRSSSCKQA